MKVPLSWLRELTPVDVDVDVLAARLHDLGLIVEAVHTPTPLDHVVVAEVKECRAIEGADRVQLVIVDDGSGPREVMCGAFNFGPGDRVPLALPGAVLAGGLRIDVREVRSLGITSHGMLCAPDELGVGEDHDGILVFDSAVEVGGDVATVLGLTETVIELEITPNRPDCMGMVGVAREVAAAFGLPLRVPDSTVEATGADVATLASVEVHDPARCPRYVAAAAVDITIGPSPAWMAARLQACGVRPINNVVDVTNYVMLEWGQPLHGFDLDLLSGNAVVVRDAHAGETLRTLDGELRTLVGADLLICDAERPVAIAGVMGGEDSEVSPATTRVLVESANFAAPSVMGTSKRLGLRTEASARFERGVDPGVCEVAALRAVKLLRDVAGAVVCAGTVDVKEADPTPRALSVRPTRVNRLLGTDLEPALMLELLAGIEIDSTGGDDLELHVRVPTWRVDLEREIDLVEEIARLYGYNNIERSLPGGRDRVGGLTAAQHAERRLRDAVLAAGADEAQTTTFVSDEILDRLGWTDPARVVVLNPLQEENRYLRPSLVPNLLQGAAYNTARGMRSIRLAEIGSVFAPSGELLPEERIMLGAVFSGVDLDARVHRTRRARKFDVYDMKGFLESVCADMGLELEVDGTAEVGPELHPGRAAGVRIAGCDVGGFGQVHPRVADAFDVAVETFVAEIEIGPLLVAHAGRVEAYEPVSSYPAARVDLAFVVGEEMPAARLAATIRDAAGPLCHGVDLFDVYRGDPLDAGHKSLAFEVTFQADDRTLTDKDVTRAVEDVVTACADLGAVLRS
ncbi:MAG: phenylalanine--tRNA ligase subunit beta [Acidimicrobiia bacterium]|nr:phenylalanine--tRNA ligase subunit beta [Acidimicrobiia bacterium]